MVALEAAALTPMSESEHQRCLRRAVIASTVGTTIEWYDFLIYSTVTGLVFAKVYFPGADPQRVGARSGPRSLATTAIASAARRP